MSESLRVPAPLQDAINHVANYEPKAATWLALHDLGSATISDLDKTVSERAGLETRYNCFSKFFVETGFASTEMGESQFSSRIVRYFKPERADDVLPAIGIILPWAREYGLALKSVLAVTRANRDAKQRAPMNSLQILAAINAGNSVVDPRKSTSQTFSSTARIQEMIAEGLVEADEEINRFRINYPVYRGTTLKEHVRSEVTAVYQAVADAKYLRPNETWSVDEIMQLVRIRHGSEMVEGWEERVRQNVLRAAYATHTKSFPDVIHKQEYVHGAYKINPTYANAVARLVEDVTHLGESSQAQRKKLGDKAIELYRDKTVVHELVARGFDSNPKNGYELAETA